MPNTYRLNSHGMFDRRQDRNMRRVIFLSVEGTKTEVEYFGYINNNCCITNKDETGRIPFIIDKINARINFALHILQINLIV